MPEAPVAPRSHAWGEASRVSGHWHHRSAALARLSVPAHPLNPAPHSRLSTDRDTEHSQCHPPPGPSSNPSSPPSPPTPPLTALLGAARIYDDVPQGTPLPYVTFGQIHRARLVDRQRGRHASTSSRCTCGRSASGKKQAHEIIAAVRAALHDQPLTPRRPPPDQPAPRVLRSPPRPRRRDHPRHRPLPRRHGARVRCQTRRVDTSGRVVGHAEAVGEYRQSRRLTSAHSPLPLPSPPTPPHSRPIHQGPPQCPPRKAKTSSSRSTATAPAPSPRWPACARARIAFNTETVDITHAESAGQWRELLAGAGAKHARVTGAGIFKDAASDALCATTSSTAPSATGRW